MATTDDITGDDSTGDLFSADEGLTILARTIVGTLALGVLAVGVGYAAWTLQAQGTPREVVVVLSSIAGLFALLSVWIGVSGAKRLQKQQQREAHLRRNPDAPWTVRETWRDGVIASSSGDAAFHVDNDRGVLGGGLQGVVHLRDAAGESVWVTLSCERIVERFGEWKRRTPWRDEQAATVSADGSVDVSFGIPGDLPAATPDPAGRPRVNWVLRVHADDENRPGSVRARFTVPVFPGDAEARHITRPDDTEAFDAPSREDATGNGLSISNTDDGVRVDAAPTLNQSSVGCGVFGLLGLAVVHGYLIYVPLAATNFPLVPILIMQGVTGLGTALFAYATLSAALQSVVLDVTEGVLAVRTEGLTSGTVFELNCAHIDDVRSIPAYPDAPNRGYALQIMEMSAAGKDKDTSHDVPVAIPSKTQADALASVLREAIWTGALQR